MVVICGYYIAKGYSYSTKIHINDIKDSYSNLAINSRLNHHNHITRLVFLVYSSKSVCVLGGARHVQVIPGFPDGVRAESGLQRKILVTEKVSV